MSNWKSAKAKKILAALEKIGWQIKRQKARIKHYRGKVGRIMFLHFTMVKKSVRK
jgi:predicted RNA binding protein YcfA (HicA-like mRNA interferase family)